MKKKIFIISHYLHWKVSLKKWLAYFIISINIIACHKNFEVMQVIEKQNYKAEIVSKEIALTIAKHISPNKYTKLPNDILKSTLSNVERPIANIFTIDDEQHVPALYLISYTNDSGFVVISAERNYNSICGYIPNGTIKKDTIPGGLDIWFKTTLSHIFLVRSGKYDNSKFATSAWKNTLYEENLEYLSETLKVKPDDENPTLDPDCNSPYYNIQRGPYITTTWGQDCFYNNLVPYNCTSSYCGKAPTGCVATAMAQVLNYWHPINQYNYNYNQMPNSPNTSNTEIPRLMRDAGVRVQMNYDCAGSSANTAYIPLEFTTTFGLSSADYYYYNYLDVVRNLNNGWPVILDGCTDHQNFFGLFEIGTGDCHAWVCDGYIKSSNQCYGVLFFHMNWGWNGTYNGWFGFDNWNINLTNGGNYNFQYANNIVKEIH